jgi:hypothetical protein
MGLLDFPWYGPPRLPLVPGGYLLSFQFIDHRHKHATVLTRVRALLSRRGSSSDLRALTAKAMVAFACCEVSISPSARALRPSGIATCWNSYLATAPLSLRVTSTLTCTPCSW